MNKTNSKKENYSVLTVATAKNISKEWLKEINLQNTISFGLPEIDDRYHIWRVPLLSKNSNEKMGEAIIDAMTSLINERKTTKKEVLEKRLLGKNNNPQKQINNNSHYVLSSLRNTVGLGDSEELLKEMPAESVDLVFTSPPYYNARPEYSDFISYEEYLLKLRKIIQQVHRVLSEGRFFVINISPVLIRRANRNEASKRIAVPFDIHRIFMEEGYEFIDDIIWVKPEGAGWATGRGRRFSADRNPLQYKAVPVTEYVLVYRKQTDKLIDWHIRNYPDRKTFKESKISGEYDKTNVWHIKPTHDKKHPAIFPVELAKKVIRYYSFKNDVVLDPFAGIGTVGEAASLLERRFILLETNHEYVEEMKKRSVNWIELKAKNIHWINTKPPIFKNLSIQTKLIQ